MTVRTLCAGVLVTLVGFAASMADEMDGITWHRDMSEALKEAHSTKRPLLVFLTTDNCGYCQRMKQTTFGDRRVTSQICDSFVPLAVNSKDHPDLVRKLNAKAFPTTVMISVGVPKSQLLDRIVGYVPASSFSRRLKLVEQRTRTARR